MPSSIPSFLLLKSLHNVVCSCLLPPWPVCSSVALYGFCSSLLLNWIFYWKVLIKWTWPFSQLNILLSAIHKIKLAHVTPLFHPSSTHPSSNRSLVSLYWVICIAFQLLCESHSYHDNFSSFFHGFNLPAFTEFLNS